MCGPEQREECWDKRNIEDEEIMERGMAVRISQISIVLTEQYHRNPRKCNVLDAVDFTRFVSYHRGEF